MQSELRDVNFPLVEEEFGALAERIVAAREQLLSLLSEFESHETAVDEVERSIDCLRNISEERENFVALIEGAATFLPVNLPLYSLILFGVVPHALCFADVVVRPPMVAYNIVVELSRLLEFPRYFPRIQISNDTRRDFLTRHAKTAELVIFTGTYKNGLAVRQELPKSNLFLFNGQGINPMVVARDADISLAARKTIDMKLFNSGQDCASPDMILVDASIYGTFREALLDGIKSVAVGDYKDASVRVGPLVDPAATMEAAKVLMRNKDGIFYGGNIDFSRNIVFPAIVECQESNYGELFSPIMMLKETNGDHDLVAYFEHPTYRYHAMYASLFGSSNYLASQLHTEILHDNIVLDVERGNNAYGGTAKGSSFAAHGKLEIARPILVSREVRDFVRSRIDLK